MPVTSSIVSAGASLIGTRKASKAIQKGSTAATALQKDIYDQSRSDLSPWREHGVNAINRIGDMFLGDSPDYSAFYKSPGYQFALGEGIRAIENQRSAGGLLSGRTIRDMIKFGQGHATQYFNNYVNTLQNISTAGQQATGATAQLGQQYAYNAGQNGMNAANAQAAGYMGMANAVNRGLGGYMYYEGYGRPRGYRNSGVGNFFP